MSRYAVALGSNQGDRLDHLRAAVAGLTALGEPVRVSSVYETEPVGGPAQPRYLNAVVLLESDLGPRQLLLALQAIETGRGREREVRWGPRTLDLDIVAWDGPPVMETDLEIPHPRAGERDFVLAPLDEVWPETLVGSRTASGGVGVRRLLRHWIDPAAARRTALLWVAAQFVLLAVFAVLVPATGSTGPSATRLWVAGLLLVAGLVLAVGGALTLGAALTPLPVPRPDAPLIETGVYAQARHPVYGGVLLIAAGVGVAFASVAGLLGVGVVALFFTAKSGFEERLLRLVHPGYADYRSRVRRRFIPFLI